MFVAPRSRSTTPVDCSFGAWTVIVELAFNRSTD